MIARAITFPSARSIPDPAALAILDAGAIVTMAVDAPDAAPLRTLWRISRAASAAVSPDENLALPIDRLSDEAFKKAAKRCIWSMGREHPSRPLIRKQLKAPASFRKIGPSQRVGGVLKRLESTPPKVNRFVKDNSQRNLLKKTRGSLPSVWNSPARPGAGFNFRFY